MFLTGLTAHWLGFGSGGVMSVKSWGVVAETSLEKLESPAAL